MRRTDDGRDALVLCTMTRRTARSTKWWHVRRRGRQKRCQRSAMDQPAVNDAGQPCLRRVLLGRSPAVALERKRER